MTIALMFLSGLLARAAASSVLKAVTGVAAILWPPNAMDRRRAEWPKRCAGTPRADTERHRSKAVPAMCHDVQAMLEVSAVRTKRHPHQVMLWEELETGRKYTSVHVRECDGRLFEYGRTFAGIFWRKPNESELPPKAGGSHHANMKFTVHIDGWTPFGFTMDKPSYVVWGGDGKPNTYSSVAYLLDGVIGDNLDEPPRGDLQHHLLVPTDRWHGNPRVAVDWAEERPRGKRGEMVWMYDDLDHTQRAAVISGDALGATRGAGEPIYYVDFIRRNGSCTLRRRSELTVRRDSEPVDNKYAGFSGTARRG